MSGDRCDSESRSLFHFVSTSVPLASRVRPNHRPIDRREVRPYRWIVNNQFHFEPFRCCSLGVRAYVRLGVGSHAFLRLAIAASKGDFEFDGKPASSEGPQRFLSRS